MFLVQLLLLTVLANTVGLGAVGALAVPADPHLQSWADASGGGGGEQQAPGCSHACHLAYHLVAPVSQPTATGIALHSHAAPAYSPHHSKVLRQKVPFQPPRALV